MWRFPVSILLLLFTWVPVQAQERPSVRVSLYNEANGGPSGLVNCIYQAKSGYLWFGCTNGLVRFDGYSFHLFTNEKGQPSNVTRLVEDRQGNLWVSFAEGGLAKYTPASNRFTNFVLQDEKDPAVRSAQVMTLYFDSGGKLWIGTAKNGLLLFDAARGKTTVYKLTNIHPGYAPALQKVYNTVYAIKEDAQRHLWLATHDGLYTLASPAGQLQAVRPAPVEPKKFRKDLFNDLVPDGDSIWLGAWGGGLSCYNRKTGTWQNFLPSKAAFGKGTTNVINGLSAKNEDELWLCSVDNGLGVFDKKNKRFSFFRDFVQDPDLPRTEIWGMQVDKDGNVWAVDAQQVVKLQVNKSPFLFTALPVSRTDNQSNFSLVDYWEDESFRLIATDYADGLHVYSKADGRTSTLPVAWLPDEEQSMHVRKMFCDSRKRVWVITRDYIYRFNRQRRKLEKIPQPPLYTADSLSNQFMTAGEDAGGKIWIGTRRTGLYVWDDALNGFEHYHSEAPGNYRLPSNYIRSVATDGRGRLWVAGSEGILGYFNHGDKKFRNLAAGSGNAVKLPGNKGYALYRDAKGNIWAGTSTGLCYFDCSGKEPALIKTISSANGLRSDLVYDINADRQGNLWCLTESGLSYIPQNNSPIATYSISDGINKGTGTRILQTSTDTMLLLNFSGYYRFLPQQLLRHEKSSPLFITAMQVNGKAFYFEEALKSKGVISLAPAQNYFSFEFAALNYIHPEKQQYAYMLEGVDEDWIQAGNRRFVSYTNVPGGDYTFKVKTFEPGYGKEAIVSIPLSIATPFYKTIWFYALLAFITAAILYALHRNRVAHHNKVFGLETKAQRLEKEKALVMYEGLKQQLNPHFLFNSLTALNSLILKDQHTARNFLERLSDTFRYILKSRDRELVGLTEEIAFAETYIQLQKTRFKETLQVNINVSDEYATHKIVPVTIQNLVENATKHNILDNETPLVIDIFTRDGYIIVRNNLQKKKIVETSNKQGLRNLKTLYGYLTDQPVIIEDTGEAFAVHIPLIP